MSGVLWGLGVGPGDPELLTLKAARLLGAARVVAWFARQGTPGRARTVAEGLLPANAEEIPLRYPVTTEIPVSDPAYVRELDAFYDEAARRLAERLGAGRDVVVLCEGDPFLYGSYMHLHRRLARRFDCRAVPGVTAMAGCWAAAGLPIAWGDDTLSVLPATLGGAVLRERLQAADAAVVMKVGRNLGKVREALAGAGALDRAVYVEHGTTQAQLVAPVAEVDGREAPYFSLVLVPGRGRGA